MKKVSTAVATLGGNISQPQKLTIGLNLGDRHSGYCVLDEVGDPAGTARGYACERLTGSLRQHAARSDRAGDGDAFALDQSRAGRVGA